MPVITVTRPTDVQKKAADVNTLREVSEVFTALGFVAIKGVIAIGAAASLSMLIFYIIDYDIPRLLSYAPVIIVPAPLAALLAFLINKGDLSIRLIFLWGTLSIAMIMTMDWMPQEQRNILACLSISLVIGLGAGSPWLLGFINAFSHTKAWREAMWATEKFLDVDIDNDGSEGKPDLLPVYNRHGQRIGDVDSDWRATNGNLYEQDEEIRGEPVKAMPVGRGQRALPPLVPSPGVEPVKAAYVLTGKHNGKYVFRTSRQWGPYTPRQVLDFFGHARISLARNYLISGDKAIGPAGDKKHYLKITRDVYDDMIKAFYALGMIDKEAGKWVWTSTTHDGQCNYTRNQIKAMIMPYVEEVSFYDY